MKTLLVYIWLLGILLPTLSHAQNDTTYCIKSRATIGNVDTMTIRYCRVVSMVPDSAGVYAYRETDLLDSSYVEGSYIAYNSDVKVGREIKYYSNGIVAYKGLIKNWNSSSSSNIGTWQYFRANGQREKDIKYLLDIDKQQTIELYWAQYNDAGQKILANGTGMWRDTTCTLGYKANCMVETGALRNGFKFGEWKNIYVDGKPYTIIQYDSSKVVSGVSYDAQGTAYDFTQIEEFPEFPGGDIEMIRFLSANVVYPRKELENDIQGTVYIRFLVNGKGYPTNIEILKGVSPGIDKEALRVVRLLPRFKPGKQLGQPVSVYYGLPMVFKLQ